MKWPPDPIHYEDIRERYLPEATFRGLNEHHRSHYALGAAAMIRAGVQPDLLGEIQWWGTDDLWEYALYALVIYVSPPPNVPARPSGKSALDSRLDTAWRPRTSPAEAPAGASRGVSQTRRRAHGRALAGRGHPS